MGREWITQHGWGQGASSAHSAEYISYFQVLFGFVNHVTSQIRIVRRNGACCSFSMRLLVLFFERPRPFTPALFAAFVSEAKDAAGPCHGQDRIPQDSPGTPPRHGS